MDGLEQRFHLRPHGGRPGTRVNWLQAARFIGYALGAVAALVIARLVLAAGLPMAVLCLWLLLAVWIDTNFLGLRERLPGFTSASRLCRTAAWTTFALVGLLGFGAALLAPASAGSDARTAPESVVSASAPSGPAASPAQPLALPGAAVPSDPEAAPVAATPTQPVHPGSAASDPTATAAPGAAGTAADGGRHPESVDWLLAHVDLNWDRDWDETIWALEQLRVLDPERPEWREKLYAAYNNDANRYLAEGRWGEAEWRLRQAQALDPTRGIALYKLRRLIFGGDTPIPVDVVGQTPHVPAGGTVTLIVQTLPGAECGVEFVPEVRAEPSGATFKSDADGRLRWSWRLREGAPRGEVIAYVACALGPQPGSATATLQIE